MYLHDWLNSLMSLLHANWNYPILSCRPLRALLNPELARCTSLQFATSLESKPQHDYEQVSLGTHDQQCLLRLQVCTRICSTYMHELQFNGTCQVMQFHRVGVLCICVCFQSAGHMHPLEISAKAAWLCPCITQHRPYISVGRVSASTRYPMLQADMKKSSFHPCDKEPFHFLRGNKTSRANGLSLQHDGARLKQPRLISCYSF